MEIQIGPARAANLAGINALIDASKRTWPYDPAYLAAAMPLLRIDTSYLSRAVCLEARDGASLLGFSAMVREPDGVVVLEHLWVAPAAQRQGVGSKLWARCLEICRSRGWKQLRVASDPPAEGFYLHHGFTRVSERRSRIRGGPPFPVLELTLP